MSNDFGKIARQTEADVELLGHTDDSDEQPVPARRGFLIPLIVVAGVASIAAFTKSLPVPRSEPSEQIALTSASSFIEVYGVPANSDGNVQAWVSAEGAYLWKTVSGPSGVSLTWVSTGPTSVWGVDGDGNVYRCGLPCTGSWDSVSGQQLVQLDVGETEVWGIDSDGAIYYTEYAEDSTSGWTNVQGSLTHVSVGENFVWGVNTHTSRRRKGKNNIYMCTRPCTGSWTNVDGELTNLDVGGGTEYQAVVWGVNSDNEIYTTGAADDGAGGWTKMSGPAAKQISVGSTYVWAVSTSNDVYQCTLPCYGPTWVQVSGSLTQIGASWSFGVNPPAYAPGPTPPPTLPTPQPTPLPTLPRNCSCWLCQCENAGVVPCDPSDSPNPCNTCAGALHATDGCTDKDDSCGKGCYSLSTECNQDSWTSCPDSQTYGTCDCATGAWTPTVVTVTCDSTKDCHKEEQEENEWAYAPRSRLPNAITNAMTKEDHESDVQRLN